MDDRVNCTVPIRIPTAGKWPPRCGPRVASYPVHQPYTHGVPILGRRPREGDRGHHHVSWIILTVSKGESPLFRSYTPWASPVEIGTQ